MFSYYELPADDPTAQLTCGPIKGQNLNHVLSLDLPSSFIFTMSSARYRQLGICAGDLVVVRRDLIPERGQLVLVKTHGKFMLQTFVYAGAVPDLGSKSSLDQKLGHEGDPGSGPKSAPASECGGAGADGASTDTGSYDPAVGGAVPGCVHYGPDGTPDFELFGVVAAVFRKLGRSRPRPEQLGPRQLQRARAPS